MSFPHFSRILKVAALTAVLAGSGCLGILSLTEKKEKDANLMALLGLGAGAVVGGGTATPAAGATLSSSDGLFQITIPPGAMTDSQTFTITKFAPSGVKLPGGYYATSPVYDVQPSYAFLKDVDVSIVLDSTLVASYGAQLSRSRVFMSSSTSTETDNRVPGWQGQEGSLVDYRLTFKTRTFSTFGGGTPPAGNLAPTILGAFYYFKPTCQYLPYRVRTRVVEPDGDTFNVYLITGPVGGGTGAIPMVAEGGGWFGADLPYAAMGASGIQMQVLAVDQYGNNSSTPGSSVFQYPASSGNATFIAGYDRDKRPGPNGLLDAWEVDHMPGGNTTDTDGDGIPDSHDDTPNGETNPVIDASSLVIVPSQVLMDVGETVTFSATATKSGLPVFVIPTYVTTGNGIGGGAVGIQTGAVFTASVPGVAGVTASVDVQNAVASITVSDTVGPNNITDLAAAALTHSQVRLNWTAPGNDGAAGKAASYEVRRSNASISTNADCSAAAPMAQTMIPKNAGVAETLDINGLSPGTAYYFCVRAFDSSGNRNTWTGTVSATTGPMPDMTPPADIAGVTATPTAPDKVQLSWTAVGDDGNTGSAQTYEIRRSTSPINNNTQCDSGANVTNSVTAAAAGSPLGFTVTGLSENTVYYFCVRAFDDANNRSSWSGLTTATTQEGNDPPVANAGPDQNVTLGVGQSVVFSGTGSSDPDAVYCGANTGNYVYAWTLASKPPTSGLTTGSIVGAGTLTPSVVPDVAGTYNFQLAFTDDPGACGGGTRLNVDLVQVTVAFDLVAPTVAIGNLRNNSVVETGFVIGTSGDVGAGLAAVQVSLDGGAYAPANLNPGTGAWKFQLPTGALTWREGTQHTIAVRSVDAATNNSVVVSRTVRKGTNKDVNGDGYADMLTGAPYYGSQTGRAYIFHSTGSAGIPQAAAASTVLTGPSASSYFGLALALGDVNGDGYADAIIVANPGTVTAYIFHSAGTGGIADAGSASANTILTGDAASAGAYGGAIAVGDINGDGYADAIISSRFYNATQGRAYIFQSAGSTGVASAGPGAASTTLTGESASAFGTSLAVGDVNGDGYADLLVGAGDYNSGRGRAYIFHSAGAGGIATVGAASANTILSTAAFAFLGQSVALGDTNGDGYADAVVGAYSVGAVYVFHSAGALGVSSAAVGAENTLLTEEVGGSVFGFALAVGDVNGDGFADVLVGAHGYSTTGRAYIFHSAGGPGIPSAGGASANTTFTGGGGYGTGLAVSFSDITGDGFADALVSIATYNIQQGAVIMYVSPGSGGIVTGVGSNAVYGEGGGNYFGFSIAR